MGAMDKLEKLSLSSQAALFESIGECRLESRPPSRRTKVFGYTASELRDRYSSTSGMRWIEVDGRRMAIHLTSVPNGRRVPVLKAMLTTACERDCRYCIFYAGRNFQRITFKPEELARTYHAIHQAGLVDGLFLSSGIFAGGTNTQNHMLDMAEFLRHKLRYRGYLHLKIMPGAERGQVFRAMQLADRVSVNLEAPNSKRLACLAPTKDFSDELLQPLRWIEEIRRETPSEQGWGRRWPSSTTQFVVGAAGESDLEILTTVAHLNQAYSLSRAYFEAFTPVQGTPLENHPAEDPLRQHRLYQASYLLRDYGFDLEDLPFTRERCLPINIDPKLAYAQTTLSEAPIEINRAEREKLLRVPGIGPRGAEAIIQSRQYGSLRQLSDLRKIGVIAERAAPYITLNGKRPPQQLTLL